MLIYPIERYVASFLEGSVLGVYAAPSHAVFLLMISLSKYKFDFSTHKKILIDNDNWRQALFERRKRLNFTDF